MRHFLMTAVAGLGFAAASAATAQDMGTGYDWTGLSDGVVGGHLGLAADVGGFRLDGTPSPIVDDFSMPIDGIAGGIALGANLQYEQFVFGVEGDFLVSNAEGRHADSTANFVLAAKPQRLATIRGREG